MKMNCSTQSLKLALLLCAVPAALLACASQPTRMESFEWVDEWGRRGAQEKEKALLFCTERDQRQEQELTACMEKRGWRLRM